MTTTVNKSQWRLAFACSGQKNLVNSENKENLSNYQLLKREPSVCSTSLHFSKLITAVQFFRVTPVLQWFQLNFGANLVPRASVTLVQRNGKTKYSGKIRLSSAFHWPLTERAQFHRKLINNNFVPRGPFLESPGKLTGPVSYFEIEVSRKVGCALTSN